MTVAELVERAHTTAIAKGWWDDTRNVGEIIALMHSELSEALEVVRSGRSLRETWVDTDGKPCGFLVELADCVIRIADVFGFLGMDMAEVLERKLSYNETRPRKHGKMF